MRAPISLRTFLNVAATGASRLAALTLVAVLMTSICAHAQGTQKEVLHFTHIDDVQQINETATLIRKISDLQSFAPGKTSSEFVAAGSPSQLALAGWLMNELDRGPGDTRDPSEYTVSGDDQGTYRIVYAPYTKTIQELQEAATIVAAIEEIHRMFTVNTPRAVAMRGTLDHCAAAEWVFGELAKPQGTVPARYQGRGEKDEATEVLHLQTAKTFSDYQEIAVTVRTISRILYL